MFQVYDVLQTLQEPYINFGQFLDTLNGVAFFQSLCNSKDTQVCGVSQFFVQVLKLSVVVTYKTMHALTNHTQTFLYHFLE